jgi:signal transduction histidine kinase
VPDDALAAIAASAAGIATDRRFVTAATIGVGGLFYEGVQTADAMRRDELLQRARELARHIVGNPDGTIAVALPAELDQVYRAPNATDQFSVRSGNGQALAASQPEFARATGDWPLGNAEPRYVRLKRFGPAGQEYCALTVGMDSGFGPVSVTVGRAIAGDALAQDILQDFVWDIAWAIPLFAAVMLTVGVWGVRSDLRPLRADSAHAATIGPESTGVRLATGQLPTELTPLVVAINKAFDRLEQGLTLQREFTANAAHQLRTPLTILTA